ncbi:MAG: S8 family serine peptidase [Bacteroidota bacterium]
MVILKLRIKKQKVALSCVLFILFTSILSAQRATRQNESSIFANSTTNLSNIIPGIIHFKVTPEIADQLQTSSIEMNEEGNIVCGVNTLDQTLSRCGVTSLKRVFRHGGKFESKHRKHGLHQWYKVNFDELADVAAIVKDFQNSPGVLLAEPQYEIIMEPDALSTTTDESQNSTSTQRPDYSIISNAWLSQWHYENLGQDGGKENADIDLYKAWEIETGDQDVIVAIHDSNFDFTHRSLENNLWTNPGEIPGNNIDDDNNGYVDDIHGYNFVRDTTIIELDERIRSTFIRHGTHVAGTVGGQIERKTSAGFSVNTIAGVAGGLSDEENKGVRLMSAEVFYITQSGGFDESYVFAADNGAVISQNSWGYTIPNIFSQSIKEAIDYFIAEAGYDENGMPYGPMQGGLVIFAAGNSGSDLSYYPAAYERVISVAATDRRDRVSFFSNHGPTVDIAAPGSAIYSTLPNQGEGYLSGTSMACPHVSGVAALVLSANKGKITPDGLRSILLSSTDQIDSGGLQIGSGRLNAYKALSAVQDGTLNPIADLALKTPPSNHSAVLSWTVAAAPNNLVSKFDIRISEEQITSQNFADAEVENSDLQTIYSGTTIEFPINGLKAGTTYYVAIKSLDVFGNASEISNVLTFTVQKNPQIQLLEENLLNVTLKSGESKQVPVKIKNDGEGDLLYYLQDDFASTTFSFLKDNNNFDFSNILDENTVITAVVPPKNIADQALISLYEISDFDSFIPGEVNKQQDWIATQGAWEITTNPETGKRRIEGTIIKLPENEPVPRGDFFNNPITSSYLVTPEISQGSNDYITMKTNMRFQGQGSEWIFELISDESVGRRTAFLDFYQNGQLYMVDHNTGQWRLIGQYPYDQDFDFTVIAQKKTRDIWVYLDNQLLFKGRTNAKSFNRLFVGYNHYRAFFPTTKGDKFFLNRIEFIDGVPQTLDFVKARNKVGKLDAGQILTYNLKIDAANMKPGAYHTNLSVFSNDPESDCQRIPINLIVEPNNEPIIDFSKKELLFEEVILGTQEEKAIKIANEGSEPLYISDITYEGDTTFDVKRENNIDTIPPFSNKRIKIVFTPKETQTYQGTIKVVSNDNKLPLAEIPVSGEGKKGAQIGVDQNPIEVSIAYGENEIIEIPIQNTGEQELNYFVSLKEKRPLKVGVIGTTNGLDSLFNQINAFPEIHISKYPASKIVNNDLRNEIENFDVIVLEASQQWGQFTDENGELMSINRDRLGDIIAEYIDNGGKVVVHSPLFLFPGWSIGGEYLENRNNYYPIELALEVKTSNGIANKASLVDKVHPFFIDFEDMEVFGSTSWRFNDLSFRVSTAVKEGATTLAKYTDGLPMAVIKDNVVALNFNMGTQEIGSAWKGDVPRLYANIFSYLAKPIFTSRGKYGLLAPGQDRKIRIPLRKTENLSIGSHELEFWFRSNDASNPLIKKPVLLNITGPNVDLSPLTASTDLDEQDVFNHTVTITNPDNEDYEYSLLSLLNGTNAIIDDFENNEKGTRILDAESNFERDDQNPKDGTYHLTYNYTVNSNNIFDIYQIDIPPFENRLSIELDAFVNSTVGMNMTFGARNSFSLQSDTIRFFEGIEVSLPEGQYNTLSAELDYNTEEGRFFLNGELIHIYKLDKERKLKFFTLSSQPSSAQNTGEKAYFDNIFINPNGSLATKVDITDSKGVIAKNSSKEINIHYQSRDYGSVKDSLLLKIKGYKKPLKNAVVNLTVSGTSAITFENYWFNRKNFNNTARDTLVFRTTPGAYERYLGEDDFRYKVTLFNTGGKDLVVNLKGSKDWITFDQNQLNIPIKGSADVWVMVDIKDLLPNEYIEEVIVSAEGIEDITLPVVLRNFRKPVLEVKEDTLRTKVPIDARIMESITLYNHGRNTLIYNIKQDYASPIIEVFPKNGRIRAKDSIQVNVRMDGTGFNGTDITRSKITIRTNDAENPIVKIPVIARYQSRAKMEISKLVFDFELATGDQQSQNFSIINEGEQRLRYNFHRYGDVTLGGGASFSNGVRDLNNEIIPQDIFEPGQVFPVLTGQELFSEDFNDEILPQGWIVRYDRDYSVSEWTLTTTNWTSGDGNAITFDGDTYPGNWTDSFIISPKINVADKKGVVLRYKMNSWNRNFFARFSLQIKTDESGSWEDVQLFGAVEIGDYRAPQGQEVAFELDPFLEGATEMQLRWRMNAVGGFNNFGNYFQFDDVQVLADAADWLHITPGNGNLKENTLENLSITVDASVLNPGIYEQDVVLLTNDKDSRTTVIPIKVIVTENEELLYPVAQSVSAYPVPSNGVFNLDITLEQADEISLALININQGLIQNITYNLGRHQLQSGNNIINIQQDLNQGIYELKITGSRYSYPSIRILIE